MAAMRPRRGMQEFSPSLKTLLEIVEAGKGLQPLWGQCNGGCPGVQNHAQKKRSSGRAALDVIGMQAQTLNMLQEQ